MSLFNAYAIIILHSVVLFNIHEQLCPRKDSAMFFCYLLHHLKCFPSLLSFSKHCIVRQVGLQPMNITKVMKCLFFSRHIDHTKWEVKAVNMPSWGHKIFQAKDLLFPPITSFGTQHPLAKENTHLVKTFPGIGSPSSTSTRILVGDKQ